MIRLEKRPQPSRAWSWATPLVAVLATMIAGPIACNHSQDLDRTDFAVLFIPSIVVT